MRRIETGIGTRIARHETIFEGLRLRMDLSTDPHFAVQRDMIGGTSIQAKGTHGLIEKEQNSVQFEQAVAAFLASNYFSGMSLATRRAYGSDLVDMGMHFGKQGVHEISAVLERRAEYIAACRDVYGLSARTGNRRSSVINVFSRWASSEGLVGIAPSELLHAIPIDKKSPRILSAGEQQELLFSARQNSRDAAVIALGFRTGASIGEILKLQNSDVTRLPDGSLKVKLLRRRGSEYTVELDSSTSAILDQVLENRGALFVRERGVSWRDDQHRISRQAFWQRLRKYGKAVGIPELNFRMLQNTHKARKSKTGFQK